MSKLMFRFLVLVLCLVMSSVAVFAYEDGDFQIWNSNVQDIKIGKATKLAIEEEYRYGDSSSRLFYQHYDWGFAWAFDKRFELTLGYRVIYEKVKNEWLTTDEPYTILTWKQDIWKFRFEDRNRIEYKRYRFATPNHIRYRNRFMLKYPFEFKGMKISSYTSDEIFVVSSGRGFSQNRFQSGVEIELTKYVKFDVSYMLQSMRGKGDKWTEANVLWLKNKISF